MAPSPVRADEKPAEFEEHTFAWPGGEKMPYRLLRPEKVEAGKMYPVVLILHGWAERGFDNKRQLKDYGPAFLKPDVRKRFPCYVLVPQANGSWLENPFVDPSTGQLKTPTNKIEIALDLLKAIQKEYPVDGGRLYLMGYSNGAQGVWELLSREPDVWAAAAPMAGAGDPARVVAAKHVPIWAFHGAKDPTVPLKLQSDAIDALRAADAHPMFTVYPNGVHFDARSRGLREPNLLPWMFAQRKGSPAVTLENIAGPKSKRPTSPAKK
jgi:predicted peptidase